MQKATVWNEYDADSVDSFGPKAKKATIKVAWGGGNQVRTVTESGTSSASPAVLPARKHGMQSHISSAGAAESCMSCLFSPPAS